MKVRHWIKRSSEGKKGTKERSEWGSEDVQRVFGGLLRGRGDTTASRLENQKKGSEGLRGEKKDLEGGKGGGDASHQKTFRTRKTGNAAGGS